MQFIEVFIDIIGQNDYNINYNTEGKLRSANL